MPTLPTRARLYPQRRGRWKGLPPERFTVNLPQRGASQSKPVGAPHQETAAEG